MSSKSLKDVRKIVHIVIFNVLGGGNVIASRLGHIIG